MDQCVSILEEMTILFLLRRTAGGLVQRELTGHANPFTADLSIDVYLKKMAGTAVGLDATLTIGGLRKR